MKGFDLVITLQDDCVFSERNATEGAHTALDYIPGGALLGAAAARLYKDNAATAFDWFHSGKVRFSNAYQLTDDGHRTYPIPACWHEAKNEPAKLDGKIAEDKVWRLDKMPAMQLDDNKQPVQMREGYVAQNGQLAEPEKHLRMKTAIDATTGRAKEGVLFGYDSLQAGQRFYAQIQMDSDLSEEARQQVEAVFKQPLLLGRSRSAEYGRASAEVLKRADPLTASEPDGQKITLWLQSDLMVLDQYGQPTLCPSSTDLGLPEGEFQAAESFIRTRRYSTWNAYKHGYEMERQVICKGGVLVYDLKKPLEQQHTEMLANGIGLERQAGLGQVWLNPEMLSDPKPRFSNSSEAVIKSDISESGKAPDNKPQLIAWLESRTTGKTERQNQAREARKVAELYLGFMKSARKLKGLDNTVFVGPSSSQWGDLQTQIKADNSLRSVIDSQDGSFKPRGEGWGDEFQDANNNIISFYHWFNELMQKESINKVSLESYFYMSLIREVMNKLTSAKGGQS